MEVTALKSGLFVPGRKPCDPEVEKQSLMEKVGDLDGLKEVMGNNILVAKWIRNKEGSIELTDLTKAEDKWQGKVGLVLAVGPQAYKEDETHDWAGQSVKVGDWVQYRASDGEDFDMRPLHSFKGVPCSWLKEGDIKVILNRPDFAY